MDPVQRHSAAGGVLSVEPRSRPDPFRAATVGTMSDRCDSCGDPGPDLLTVQRIYVLFDDHHNPVGERLADEFETWCSVCRITYPHQEVAPD